MLGSSELKPASAGDFDKRALDLARRELELERRELEHLRKYQLGSSHKVETAPACSNATSLFTLSATNSSSPSVDQKLVSDLCVNENPFSKDMHNPFSSNSFANPYQLPFQQLGPAPNPFATFQNRHKCGRPMYYPPAPAAMNDQSRVSELIDALSIMTNSINRSQTRTVRGDDLFYGDPIDYRRFIRYFETYTIRGVHDSATRLNLLISSCAGEAKESIVNCIMCDSPDVGYWKACHILEENFGQIGGIINAYVKKLTEGPPIKNNDSEGILKFARDLYNCELTCGSRPESGLDSQHVVGKVFARLPKSLQEKFITSVSFQLENGHPITFSQLSQFMQKQSHVERSFLNQIVKSKDPNTTNFNFSKKSCNKPAIHFTQSSIAPSPIVESALVKTNQFKEVDRKRKSCPMCVQAHPLWKCLKFQNATEKQKWNTVWKSGCCINCLGDHLVRHCQSPQRCKMCQDKHHTLLHHREHNLEASTSANNKNSGSDNGAGVDNPVKVLPNCVQIENHVNQVNSNDQLLVKSSSSQVTQDSKLNVRLKVVPVTVWSSCSDRCLNTYAFLDEGSNATLCTESLVKDLGLIGHKVEYSISTVCETKQQLGVKVSLRFCGINELAIFEAPDVLAVPHLPDLKGSIPSNADTIHFAHLHGLNFPDLGHKRVDILIGADVIKAHLADQTRSGLDNEPVGIHTPLGWSIVGPTLAATGTVGPTSLVVNFVRVDNDTLHKQLMKMFRHDFQTDNGATGLSVEDKEALASMCSSIKLNDGHYTVSLPWKHSNVTLPNNRQVALRRITHLQKRFLKDFNFYKLYEAKMKEYVINGYARKIPDDNLQPGSKTWYLPHHATGNKFRIVFDCGASFKGTSLNDNLLQGPDLTGNLLGVLTRFREGPIADIRAMFHQVKVSPEDRDSLRFFWWDNNDIASTPKEYQMLVHLFGATFSPSCCSFALRQVGIDNLANADPDVLSCLKRNFYVDDFLKSFHNEGDALRIIAQLTASLERGGFHLTKFSSSHPQILSVLPDSDLSSTMLDLNLDTAVTKVLGLIWNPTLDKLEVKVKVKYKPLTRRGILSMISQLFDPIGFLQPFILPVKLLMQELCHLNLGWDVEIPLDKKVSWYNWLDTLCSLEKFCYPRCFWPHKFKPVTYELHCFCDASAIGYSAVAYLRIIDTNGFIHVSFVMGKSRVAPLKSVTIPRLELVAAVIGVDIVQFIQHETDLSISRVLYWTDSTSVLKYISNKTKRFHVFVANKISRILEASNPSEWRYVNTKLNPADLGSRGLLPNQLKAAELWFNGPTFLKDSENCWPTPPQDCFQISDSDQEVKCTRPTKVCLTTNVDIKGSMQPTSRLLHYFSCLNKLTRAVAWFNRFAIHLHKRVTGDASSPMSLQTSEIDSALMAIVKYIQRQQFPKEMQHFQNTSFSPSSRPHSSKVLKNSSLRKLCPFIAHGVLRVGGRIHKAYIPYEMKHPVILPPHHHVTKLIILSYHLRNGHSGVLHTLSDTRERFWIINGNAAVRRVLHDCYKCRLLNAAPGKQVMSPLPEFRVSSGCPAFTSVGLDYAGPIFSKVGRSLAKRYLCVFTCMATRAVHLEIAHSLDTQSCLQALQRFIGRRGSPRDVYSDNGSNFVGAARELKEAISKWNQSLINKTLCQKGISWHFNPPAASHQGGVWERVIRSVRRILTALAGERVLTDECLSTFVTEVERILNDRPISAVSSDSRDLKALTPNSLLLGNINPVVPPNVFIKAEGYRNSWKLVHWLADEFWRRWLKSYLPQLQQRQKWLKPHRNLAPGDLVLVCDEQCRRGQWPKAIVEEVYPGDDGYVRVAKVKTASSAFKRDVRKLCLLEGAE